MLSQQIPAEVTTRSGHQHSRHGRWPAKIAVPVGAAAVAALAAGCATSSPGSSHQAASGMSPIRAVALAADQASKATSFATAFSVRMTGDTSADMTGTMQVRSQPSLLAAATFSSVNANGQNVPGGLSEITTSQSIYLKIGALQQAVGKPWVKVPLAELQQITGVNLSQVASQVQANNPLVQTQMLAASRNVQMLGTQQIDGVQTTHYSGSFPLSAALSKVPASVRPLVQQQWQKLGIQTVGFNVWIDGQHRTRRLIMAERGSHENMQLSLDVTGINQPVNVSLPPASQVATAPAGVLTGQ
jgi:hypothetical protein